MEGKRKDEWNIYVGYFKGLRMVRIKKKKVRIGIILKVVNQDHGLPWLLRW